MTPLSPTPIAPRCAPRRRLARALALATLAAAVVAGCGSGSGSPAAVTLTGPVRIPSGYATFHGPWYTLILPSSWPAAVAKEGPHTGLMSIVAPGAGADTTQGAATTLKFPRIDLETMTAPASSSRQTFDQGLATFRSGALLPLGAGNYLRGKATVTTVRVPGANEARVVNTTGATLSLHAMTLLVLAPAGVTSVDVMWTGG
jgi:hypothetical protein